MSTGSRPRRSTVNYTSTLRAEDLAPESDIDAQVAEIEKEDQEFDDNETAMDQADEEYALSSQTQYSSSQVTASSNDEDDEDAEESMDSDEQGSDDVSEWEAPSSSPRTRIALVIEPEEADEDDEQGSIYPSGW